MSSFSKLFERLYHTVSQMGEEILAFDGQMRYWVWGVEVSVFIAKRFDDPEGTEWKGFIGFWR